MRWITLLAPLRESSGLVPVICTVATKAAVFASFLALPLYFAGRRPRRRFFASGPAPDSQTRTQGVDLGR